MNRILKISIVIVICLILILGAALLLGKCKENKEGKTTAPTTPPSPPACTEHVDADGNSACDVCGATITVNPPVCTEHVDADNNSACDVCGTTITVTPPTCTEHVDADENYICDVCGDELERPTNPENDYVETNDKVYVISSMLNLRKTPNETGVATVSVTMDTELERLGFYATGANAGLSKVTYEGQIYYVATDYVTTQKPLTDADFTTVEETVYVISGRSPYVFSKPSHIEKHQYSEKIDTLVSGQAVTRLGIATKEYVDDEGNKYTFAKVTYESNGKTFTGYVNNALLTTEAPADPDNGIAFVETSVVLEVVAEVSLNLRTSAEYPADNLGLVILSAETPELQATHYGEASDGTKWYKVVVNDITYYVIDNPEFVKIKE